MRYFVQGRIDDQKGYNVPFQIVLFSDAKRNDDGPDPLFEDIFRQLKKEIQSDDRNIDFKYFNILSIEESSIK